MWQRRKTLTITPLPSGRGFVTIYHPELWSEGLVIECKWQQIGGSVDEKFPFTVLNIKAQSPYKTILLLEGGGYKKSAEKWVRNQVDDKLLHVFNMS